MNNYLVKLAALSAQRALLLGAAITFLWWWLLFDDGSQLEGRIKSTEQELATERSKEKESDAALKEIAAIQASIGTLSDQFKLVSAQLPAELQMSEIIRTVDKVSEATGVLVKVKEPRAAVKQEVVEVLPLRVVAEGTYSELTMFFYYLSTIERIVRVRTFVMNGPATERRPNTNRLGLEAEIVSYRFLPAEANKPEAPKK